MGANAFTVRFKERNLRFVEAFEVGRMVRDERRNNGSSNRLRSRASDPLMAGLKAHPRPVEGRCAACQYFSLCGGNTRVRAQQLTGNAWAPDPGCYLSDEETGTEHLAVAEPAAPHPVHFMEVSHAQ